MNFLDISENNEKTCVFFDFLKKVYYNHIYYIITIQHMFFLKQYTSILRSQIALYNWPEGNTDESHETGESAPQESAETPEAVRSLEEQLESINSAMRIVEFFIHRVWDFLNQVQEWQHEWVSAEDAEFESLRDMYNRKQAELEMLSVESRTIEETLREILQNLPNWNWESRENWSSQESQSVSLEVNALSKRLEIVMAGLADRIAHIDPEIRDQDINTIINIFRDLQWLDTRSITDTTERHDCISRTLAHFNALQVDLDIALRDNEVVWDNWEKLWERRRNLLDKKYTELQENGTEVQQNIIHDNTWEFIPFSELSSDKFWALQKEWINLAEYMLVDRQWNAFSEYEAWKEYIINCAWNPNISWYIISYIFDIEHVNKLIIDEKEYTRTNDGSATFKDNEGNSIWDLRDGMTVTVSNIVPLEDEDLTSIQESLSRSFGVDRSSAIMGEVYWAYEAVRESRWFNFSTFLDALKSWDWSTIIDQITHFLRFEIDFDTETNTFNMSDPANPERWYQVSEADMSLATLSDIPPSWRANLIRSARENGLTPEELMNHVNEECRNVPFPPANFIRLIWKESSWRSWIRNQSGSSAFWLWQIIDSTWREVGRGDRNDPKAQITWSLNYLERIIKRRNCTPEDAAAFYNTGANFTVNDSPAPAIYVQQNSVIVNYIPSNKRSNNITRRQYFIAAVAYYNDLSYGEAWNRSSFWTSSWHSR